MDGDNLTFVASGVLTSRRLSGEGWGIRAHPRACCRVVFRLLSSSAELWLDSSLLPSRTGQGPAWEEADSRRQAAFLGAGRRSPSPRVWFVESGVAKGLLGQSTDGGSFQVGRASKENTPHSHMGSRIREDQILRDCHKNPIFHHWGPDHHSMFLACS